MQNLGNEKKTSNRFANFSTLRNAPVSFTNRSNSNLLWQIKANDAPTKGDTIKLQRISRKP